MSHATKRSIFAAALISTLAACGDANVPTAAACNYAQAVQAQQSSPRQGDVLAEAHAARRDVLRLGRRYALAHANYQESIALSDAVGEGELAAPSRTVGQAAVNLAAAGVPIRALPYFERDAEEARASGRSISSFVVSAHGTTLAWVGRAAEGAALHRAALASEGARENPGSMIGLLLAAASSHLAAGDLSGAQALLEPIDSCTEGAGRVELARLNVLHGELALAQGDAPHAIQRLRAGAAMLEPSIEAADQPQRVLALVSLSNAQRAAGDAAGATATARRAFALTSSFQPHRLEVSMHVGLAELALGEALLASGARHAADSALERAVVQLEGSLGPDAPSLHEAQAAWRRSRR